MGYRLSGPSVEIAKGPGIITEPIPRGAIQVPGDGQPIVLLRDAPVTGGYGKIAVVISADLDRFVQRVPGSVDGVQFEKTSRRRALELWFEKEKQMETIKRIIRAH
jgi:allophanate hydrolase subunit 2